MTLAARTSYRVSRNNHMENTSVRIPGLGRVSFPASMTADELQDAAEDLHKRAAGIRLGRLLDDFDPATASEKTKADIYNAIIAYRQTAKRLPEEEKVAIDRRIAEYSNSQVKPKPASEIIPSAFIAARVKVQHSWRPWAVCLRLASRSVAEIVPILCTVSGSWRC